MDWDEARENDVTLQNKARSEAATDIITMLPFTITTIWNMIATMRTALIMHSRIIMVVTDSASDS